MKLVSKLPDKEVGHIYPDGWIIPETCDDYEGM